MSVTDYNARLYEKMKAEQDKYRGWLLHQEPSEILNHTYEYIVGHNDGNVYPNGLISRAETATVFFRLLKDEVRDGNLLTSNTYSDVPDDYWANTAISTMTGLGIVQGCSTDTFDPNAPTTRAQFAAIYARFHTGESSDTQAFSDIDGHWAEQYIARDRAWVDQGLRGRHLPPGQLHYPCPGYDHDQPGAEPHPRGEQRPAGRHEHLAGLQPRRLVLPGGPGGHQLPRVPVQGRKL